MADPRPANLQTIFLEHVRSKQVPVTVFLVNGIKLQGEITFYKRMISTIQPGVPVQLGSTEDGNA